MFLDILEFWFDDLEPSQWWRRDTVLDKQMTDKYLDVHACANKCELYEWRSTAKGRLAEIIVLDQFSRNIYRDKARSFASDPLALALAQEAILAGADKALSEVERSFLYVPFMHSESLIIHRVAVSLYEALGIQANLDFELKHKSIIDRFGRYPHRNEILGRRSTAAEIEFLSQPGSSF